MNKKQTAVNFLVNYMLENFHLTDESLEVFEQAKQMEKDQHNNTWTDSRIYHEGDNYIGKEVSFEEYCNETYNK